MSERPLENGHDKRESFFDPLEAAHGAILLHQHITQLEINAARQAERATVEALCQDAMRRWVEAMKRGDHQKAVEATREILRLEVYLSRRGLREKLAGAAKYLNRRVPASMRGPPARTSSGDSKVLRE